jgi:hypothetical protein
VSSKQQQQVLHCSCHFKSNDAMQCIAHINIGLVAGEGAFNNSNTFMHGQARNRSTGVHMTSAQSLLVPEASVCGTIAKDHIQHISTVVGLLSKQIPPAGRATHVSSVCIK